MKNILFYCQHLLGVGHLTRSLNICESLIKNHKVTFLQGGVDIGRTLQDPNFTPLYLEPLAMREDTSQLYSPAGLSVEEAWGSREEQLSAVVAHPWDALIVELYPFGRKKFKQEVHELIDQLRQTHPKIKVICSLRDILVEKDQWDQRQDKILKIVHEKFDHVFVHSDPELIPLDLTFQKAPQMAEKLVYTGFVSEPQNSVKKVRQKKVLVSTGGGVVGDRLVEATLSVAVLMSELQFTFIKSPNMSESLLKTLEQAKGPNIQVIDFSSDYQGLLSSCELSISLAGYNTCMNLLRTKTFGLVFPYQDSSEQLLRAGLLEDKGMLKVLKPTELEATRLKPIIESSMNRSDWSHVTVDLEGAENSAQWISSKLGE